MTQEEFNVVFELQMRKCADIRHIKRKNIPVIILTASVHSRLLPLYKTVIQKQHCTGMMSKHVVSLYDMCYSTLLHFDMEQWDEKITDCINYLILLKAR